MSYHYKAFQCDIESDIPINILSDCKSISEDITIRIYEDILLKNELINFEKKRNNYYKTNLIKTEIYIKDIALFNITNGGSSIKYVLEKEPDMTSFFSKLLNHVVPYALYMQKRFLLHASGVAFNNSGFIFLGKSGAGKSSLAASLSEMSFICEDSALIDRTDNGLYLTPSFNLVKLSSRINENLDLNNQRIANVKVDKMKRNLYKVNNFSNQRVELKRCYILDWNQKFDIQKIDRKNIFKELYSSIFGPHPINSCKESELFIYNKVTELLKNIDFYRLYRNKKNLFSDNKSIIKHMQTKNP